jgi:hypothetical protein
MRGSLLHVTQRDPGIERGGDERMSERVRVTLSHHDIRDRFQSAGATPRYR